MSYNDIANIIIVLLLIAIWLIVVIYEAIKFYKNLIIYKRNNAFYMSFIERYLGVNQQTYKTLNRKQKKELDARLKYEVMKEDKQ